MRCQDGIWRSTMYDFHDSTDTLKFWTEKRTINKTFFIFHLILMKLSEVVVTHVYYNSTKFPQNRMTNKKVLLIAHFSVQNFKVSVELWKSYIVYRDSCIHYMYSAAYTKFEPFFNIQKLWKIASSKMAQSKIGKKWKN